MSTLKVGKMVRFTISLKDDLISRIDRAMKKSPFATRSAFIAYLLEKALKDGKL